MLKIKISAILRNDIHLNPPNSNEKSNQSTIPKELQQFPLQPYLLAIAEWSVQFDYISK